MLGMKMNLRSPKDPYKPLLGLVEKPVEGEVNYTNYFDVDVFAADHAIGRSIMRSVACSILGAGGSVCLEELNTRPLTMDAFQHVEEIVGKRVFTDPRSLVSDEEVIWCSEYSVCLQLRNQAVGDWRLMHDSACPQSRDVRAKLLEFFARLKPSRRREEPVHGTLSILGTSNGGLSLFPMKMFDDVFEEENYLPDAVSVFREAKEMLVESSPRGRLLLVAGAPGSGKTHFVRSIISSSPDPLFVLVQSAMVKEFGGPELASFLLGLRNSNPEKPIVFVIEDAEHILAKRMGGNIEGISALLNMTDGMFGDALDIKVIATTNEDTVNIDPALLRDGRLFKRIEIGALPAEKATQVLRRVTKDASREASGPMTLAEIYAKAKP